MLSISLQGPPTLNPNWRVIAGALVPPQSLETLLTVCELAAEAVALLRVEEHVLLRTQDLGISAEKKAIDPEMNAVSLLRNPSTLWEVSGNGGVFGVATLRGEVCHWSYWTGRVPGMPNIL